VEERLMRVFLHVSTGAIAHVHSAAGHDGPDWQDLGELPEGWTAEEWRFDEAQGAYVRDAEMTRARLRAERDVRLRACDWTQLLDVPDATRRAWRPYRQALRDLPDTTTDPFAPVWPTPPA